MAARSCDRRIGRLRGLAVAPLPAENFAYARASSVVVGSTSGTLEFHLYDREKRTLESIHRIEDRERSFDRIAASPDGTRVAVIEESGSSGELQEIGIYSIAGAKITVHPIENYRAATDLGFVSDRVVVVLVGGPRVSSNEPPRIAFLDISTGEWIHQVQLPASERYRTLAIHPSGRILLVAGEHGRLPECRIPE